MTGKDPHNTLRREILQRQPVSRWDDNPVAEFQPKLHRLPPCASHSTSDRARLTKHQLFTDAMSMIRPRFARGDVDEPKESSRKKRKGTELGYNQRSSFVTMNRKGAELYRLVVPLHPVRLSVHAKLARRPARGSSDDIPTARAPAFLTRSRTDTDLRRHPRSLANVRHRPRPG